MALKRRETLSENTGRRLKPGTDGELISTALATAVRL